MSREFSNLRRDARDFRGTLREGTGIVHEGAGLVASIFSVGHRIRAERNNEERYYVRTENQLNGEYARGNDFAAGRNAPRGHDNDAGLGFSRGPSRFSRQPANGAYQNDGFDARNPENDAASAFILNMRDAHKQAPGSDEQKQFLAAAAHDLDALKFDNGAVRMPTVSVRVGNGPNEIVFYNESNNRFPSVEAAMAGMTNLLEKNGFGPAIPTAALHAAASAAPATRTAPEAPTIPAAGSGAGTRTGASTVGANGEPDDVPASAPGANGEETDEPGATTTTPASAKPKTAAAKPEKADSALAKRYDGVPQMKMSEAKVKEIQSALMHTKGFEDEAKAMQARGGADGKPGIATYAAFTKLGSLMTPPMKPEDIDMSNPEIEAKVKKTILDKGQAVSARTPLTRPEGIREQAALEERGEVAASDTPASPRVDQAQVAATDGEDIVVTARRDAPAAAPDATKLAAAVASVKNLDINKNGIVEKAEVPKVEMLNDDGTRMVGEAVTQNGIRRSDLGAAFADLAQSPTVSAQTVATVVAAAEKSGVKVEGGAASLNPLFANVSFGSATQFASAPAPTPAAPQVSQQPTPQPLDQTSIDGPPAGLPNGNANAGTTRTTVRK